MGEGSRGRPQPRDGRKAPGGEGPRKEGRKEGRAAKGPRRPHKSAFPPPALGTRGREAPSKRAGPAGPAALASLKGLPVPSPHDGGSGGNNSRCRRYHHHHHRRRRRRSAACLPASLPSFSTSPPGPPPPTATKAQKTD